VSSRAEEFRETLVKVYQHWPRVRQAENHPYVNGHRTVELSAFRLGPKVLLWADTSTYQVVRMVADSPASAHLNTIVASFTWAKRSAALVQQIDHPHIPAGYRQVPPGG
jgi:hypothetical protein